MFVGSVILLSSLLFFSFYHRAHCKPTALSKWTIGLLFLFGHWWHASRTLYRDSFAGIDAEIGDQVEFGLFKKLGDETTRRIPGRV